MEAKTVLVGVEGEGMVAVAVEAKRKQSLDSKIYVAILASSTAFHQKSQLCSLLQLMP